VQTANETLFIESQGWTLRVKPPHDLENAGVLLLLHGWTGDETVMWIFTRKLPGRFWILAPRGPVPSPGGGFGWLPHRPEGKWNIMADFSEVTQQVMLAYPEWLKQAGAPSELASKPFDVMGFSQGAAMSFALASYFPNRVQRVAALAGFLPALDPAHNLGHLSGTKFFIAHGSRDDTIPVMMAQQAAQTLQSAGAQVMYCESDSGHKLSLTCLKGLETFLK